MQRRCTCKTLCSFPHTPQLFPELGFKAERPKVIEEIRNGIARILQPDRRATEGRVPISEIQGSDRALELEWEGREPAFFPFDQQCETGERLFQEVARAQRKSLKRPELPQQDDTGTDPEVVDESPREVSRPRFGF